MPTKKKEDKKPTKQPKIWIIIRPFLLGGVSASLATCCTQPIDTVKVRIQLLQGGNANIPKSPLHVATSILKNEGIKSFYSGLSAAIFRQMTYGLTKLGIFRTLTNKYSPKDINGNPDPANMDTLTKLICSLTAGGIAGLVGTPGDAALVRMQSDATLPIDQKRGYKNVFNALYRMASEEGVKGFFSGASPTVIRGLLINVGMFATYDSLKENLNKYTGIERESQLNRFVSGFLSGWAAATLSLPMDFVKTRLQKQVGNSKYKGVFDCIKKVTMEEGIKTFYQGYPTFVMRISPHIMLTWVFMDNIDFYARKYGI